MKKPNKFNTSMFVKYFLYLHQKSCISNLNLSLTETKEVYEEKTENTP